MITDYSEVTATLQIRLVKLNDAWAQRNYWLALALSMKMSRDLADLAMLAMSKQAEIIDKES